MNYTNPFVALGVAQPLIVLEDQAGFIDRDEGFLFPKSSQVLGQIVGDFFNPPFNYTLSLPIEPQGSLRDVDNDGEEDTGVMTFAVAYWTNTFGDPFLEQRDQGGGGWSTAFATTRAEDAPSGKGEIIGGKYIVWAPDDQQGFPSGFGEDGKLFTEDDPIVRLPAGYTIVDMDTDPFTFDRSASPEMELVEPPSSALDDFSSLGYVGAFDAMIDLFRREYCLHRSTRGSTGMPRLPSIARASRRRRPTTTRWPTDVRCATSSGRSLTATSTHPSFARTLSRRRAAAWASPSVTSRTVAPSSTS